MDSLRKTLEVALNVHSAENGSNTPDYVLAEYLTCCLLAFDRATRMRAKHFDPDLRDSAKTEVEKAKRDCKR